MEQGKNRKKRPFFFFLMDPSFSSALVIWGNTGKRVQFTRQDLQMPESVKGRPNCRFFERQWDALAGFWMNRVLKETALQHMTVSDIVQCIVAEIEKRWEQRRREKALYKKRKRLLDPNNLTAAGAPSPHVLITNIVSFEAYKQLCATDALEELVAAVLGKVEEIAKEKVVQYRILVDDADDDGKADDGSNDKGPDNKDVKGDGDEELKRKKRKLEEGTEACFDDRVAIVCTLSSEVRAASVVAELHGSAFDARGVLCRFYAL